VWLDPRVCLQQEVWLGGHKAFEEAEGLAEGSLIRIHELQLAVSVVGWQIWVGTGYQEESPTAIFPTSATTIAHIRAESGCRREGITTLETRGCLESGPVWRRVNELRHRDEINTVTRQSAALDFHLLSYLASLVVGRTARFLAASKYRHRFRFRTTFTKPHLLRIVLTITTILPNRAASTLSSSAILIPFLSHFSNLTSR
jgi:hypothetical protein